MSRTEQAALVAFFNAFKLSKPLDSFDQLSDGKALMEVSAFVQEREGQDTDALTLRL